MKEIIDKLISKLKPNKPIVAFDVESTGVDPAKDRIITISVIKIDNTTGTSKEYTYMVNPGMPIPGSSTAVHNITDEMVRDEPSFKDISKDLFENFFKGSDLMVFNRYFDPPILYEEFSRAGIEYPGINTKIIDFMKIYHIKERRDLSSGYKFFTGKDFTGAHNSMNDIKATLEIFDAQIDKYNDIPDNVEDLHNFCAEGVKFADFHAKLRYNEEGEVVYNFGKNNGKRVVDDFEYARWLVRDSDFPKHTKKVVTELCVAHKNKLNN